MEHITSKESPMIMTPCACCHAPSRPISLTRYDTCGHTVCVRCLADYERAHPVSAQTTTRDLLRNLDEICPLCARQATVPVDGIAAARMWEAAQEGSRVHAGWEVR
jgi:hypothetical protein